jgi:hypothetical protein
MAEDLIQIMKVEKILGNSLFPKLVSDTKKNDM